ncbi:MAG: hypothetical protein GQ559_05830 [Desulfobulbaceae bacterium]|nr:hypothetical protein [Desulfobulbaceae bacterium]
MAQKPTYEELEQKIRELKKETFDRKQVEDALYDSRNKWRNKWGRSKIK